jgi:RNA recognition motif-containing protein
LDEAKRTLVLLESARGISLAFTTWRATMMAPFDWARKDKNEPRYVSTRSSTVGKKLYVGNLSYSVTSQTLEELFSQFGAVRSAEVIQDRETGRSKGFGFVEMADDNGARAAITGLHEKEHEGRPLTVNEARPREDRGGPRGGGGGGGGGRGYGGGGGGGGRRY